MKRRTVLTFRVPAERRVRALFSDDPHIATDLDRVGKQIGEALTLLYRQSPHQAVKLAQATHTLLMAHLQNDAPVSDEGGRS